ncbi:hypothetical protein B0H10DRAFT_2114031 [Mycena sp. CBHHK59/15]|nr:hypothetical protein B0H10DRAFT_2114031 [Mycena sp. CBHHK59/15]
MPFLLRGSPSFILQVYLRSPPQSLGSLTSGKEYGPTYILCIFGVGRPLLIPAVMSDSATNTSSSQPEVVILTNPFFGNSFNWLLMGVLSMQLYTYWRNYPKDRVLIKLLVYTLFVLNLAQTAFASHEAWWYLIEHWGNTASLQLAPWTAVMAPIFCGLVSAPVQIFYAFRIWILGKNITARLLAILIVSLGLAQSIAAIVGSVVVEEELTQENLLRMHPIFTFWLAGAFVTDIFIAATMIWILHTAKSESSVSQTESLLNRLILNTVRTGSATVLGAAIDLAMFVKYTNANYHFAFVYVLGKLPLFHPDTQPALWLL